MLSMEIRKIYKGSASRTCWTARSTFEILLRLQAELIKVQDWVQHTGAKVCILFEGRDSAGKGGVIKRITQRLNPRVARVVALCRRRAAGNRASGISSATSRTCRQQARSFCSTGPGTTGPGSNE